MRNYPDYISEYVRFPERYKQVPVQLTETSPGLFDSDAPLDSIDPSEPRCPVGLPDWIYCAYFADGNRVITCRSRMLECA
jgi:hypothetical protein